MEARKMLCCVRLAVLAGFVAVSAYGGAAGLITGRLRPAASMTENLPFGSLAFAGIALACVVAAPATIAVVLAWHDAQDAARHQVPGRNGPADGGGIR
jgi:hypothetical protein